MSTGRRCSPRRTSTPRWSANLPSSRGSWGVNTPFWMEKDPVVAKAIYEHYLPTAAGGELPETDEGAVVSIADKLDTICGFFGVGLIPTGTADPYALRRQALGVINIILKKRYPLALDTADRQEPRHPRGLAEAPTRRDEGRRPGIFPGPVRKSAHLPGPSLRRRGRRVCHGDQGSRQGGGEDPGAWRSSNRIPTSQPLAVAFKRVVNIIRNAEKGSSPLSTPAPKSGSSTRPS